MSCNAPQHLQVNTSDPVSLSLLVMSCLLSSRLVLYHSVYGIALCCVVFGFAWLLFVVPYHIPYTVLSTQYRIPYRIPHRIPYTVYRILYTVYRIPYTVYRIPYTVYRTVLYCVMLCCVGLGCVVLCFVVLCYAMLCCIVLYCIVLYCIVLYTVFCMAYVVHRKYAVHCMESSVALRCYAPPALLDLHDMHLSTSAIPLHIPVCPHDILMFPCIDARLPRSACHWILSMLVQPMPLQCPHRQPRIARPHAPSATPDPHPGPSIALPRTAPGARTARGAGPRQAGAASTPGQSRGGRS